jgi:cold shock CspA family protein
VLTGKVKRFNPITKYGFIVPDGGGEDVYVHAEACVSTGGSVCLDAGVDVEFTAVNTRGKWKASRVTLPGGKPFQGVGISLEAASGAIRPAVQPSSLYQQQMGMPTGGIAPWAQSQGQAYGDTGDQLQRGIIKRFNPKSQYGFLTDGKGGPDIFCHSEVVEPYGFELTADLEVHYTCTNRGGRLKATRVIVPGALPPALSPAHALAALRPTGAMSSPAGLSAAAGWMGAAHPMGMGASSLPQMQFGDYHSLGADPYGAGVADLPQLDPFISRGPGGAGSGPMAGMGAMGAMPAQIQLQMQQMQQMQQQLQQQMQQMQQQQQQQQQQQPGSGPYGPVSAGRMPPARFAPY